MTVSIAVVSTALPPGHSGQAIVLERLLRERDARYWFLSDNPDAFTQTPPDRMGEYRILRELLFGLSMRELPGVIGSLNARLGVMRPVRIRATEIVESLAAFQPDIIIGCSGNPFDLPAAAIAAEKLGARFFAYLFDDPVFQWPAGRRRNLVRRLEPVWTARAETVICPNEALAGVIAGRTGLTPTMIRNPMDDAFAATATLEPPKQPGSPTRILYSGAVCESQGDAFANLAEVLRRGAGRSELHVFTRQTESEMAVHGLSGPCIFRHDHVSPARIAEEQRAADVLFLPLAFNSTIQDVLMSSSPGKLGEYLASHRPVLVHAPKGSFLAEFMREHDAGYVVDSPSVDCLAEAVESLIGDAELRARIVKHALCASSEFTEAAARDRFWQLVTSRPKR